MAAELHVTSPFMSGPAVLAVQKRLVALGYAPGALDGAYGPTVAAAVQAFQRDRQLEADGVAGPLTLAALKEKPAKAPAALTATATSASAPAPAPASRRLQGRSSLGEQALAEAITHIGVKEKPAGSNKSPFGQWFGVDGVPWCNVFVSYCFQIGASYTICKGFKGAGAYPGKGSTYVPTTEAWLQTAGFWVGRTEPRPGDIAIFNWDGGRPDHIGIVEEYLGDGQFHAIEGNTAVGNDSNGGEVMRRLRNVAQVNGFGRVATS